MIEKVRWALEKLMSALPGVNPGPPFEIPGREEVSPAEDRGDMSILAGPGDSILPDLWGLPPATTLFLNVF